MSRSGSKKKCVIKNGCANPGGAKRVFQAFFFSSCPTDIAKVDYLFPSAITNLKYHSNMRVDIKKKAAVKPP